MMLAPLRGNVLSFFRMLLCGMPRSGGKGRSTCNQPILTWLTFTSQDAGSPRLILLVDRNITGRR